MKKLFILFIIVLMLTTSGCDPTYGSYPWQLDKCWYCKELDMTLDYRKETLEQIPVVLQTWSSFTWNGETINVMVDYTANELTFFLRTKRPDTKDNATTAGRWEYDGDSIVFEVTDDDIFNDELVGMKFVFTVVE